MSLRRLGLERIDLFQLHRIDPTYPVADQVGRAQAAAGRGQDPPHRALRGRRRRSSQEAQKTAEIVSVQNLYNLANRDAEDAARALHAARTSASSRGSRSPPASCPRRTARWPRRPEEHDATPSQLALAWLLKRSPVMLPIPGTSSVDHLESNTAAAAIDLDDEEFDALADAA